MNFDLSEEQDVVRALAAQIFEHGATVERVKAAEQGDGFDKELWRQLADANLIGLCLPEALGGSGMGMVELVLLLEQQGRRVAPVPLWSTVVLGALAIAEFGTPEQCATWLPGVISGEVVLSAALAEAGANDALRPSVVAVPADGGVRLRGSKPAVPYGQHARRILMPARRPDGTIVIALVDPTAAGVTRTAITTTNHEPQAHLDLDVHIDDSDLLGGPQLDSGDALAWLLERALAGLCALQLGVAEESLRITAEHVSNRIQFGKPLSAFQAVTQRAADGYITCEAMRVTTLNAAWRLAEGIDAAGDVLVAAYWATDGGQEVVTASQHLHGGLGADVDYPVHRYFLWGIQLATALGGASAQLARLGRLIATA
ncbi:MAG: acyl-CoA dehydrogenase family protein [Acidimicrobiia bacterium]